MKKTVLILSLLAIGLSGCGRQSEVESPRKELGLLVTDLDSTIDPCEDFYAYIVKGWQARNPIPKTESRWGNFNILVEENYTKLHGLLDSLADMEGQEKGSHAQLVGDFYASAMDSATIESRGLQPVADWLKRIDELKDHDQWLALMADFKANSLRHPWSTYVGVDDKNSNAYLLEISQSGLGLPDRAYYLKADSADLAIQTAYRKHLANVLAFTGLSPEDAAAAANEVYLFENSLAEAQMSREERRIPEKVYNKLSREELLNLSEGLKLAEYFAALKVDFDSVNVAQVDYLEALAGLIREADLAVLKDYARWHLINGSSEYLPMAVQREDFDFYGRTLYGKNTMQPRWRRSLSTVEGGLGEQLGRIYVEEYFPESSKAAVEQMVEDLRSAYRERINGLDWMTDSTKGRALEKLAAFKYKIGYPDSWKDYSDLDIRRDDLFGNGLRLARYRVAENLARLGKQVDKSEWFMPPHQVNAYYSSSYNEIVFPAGILQPPFYSPETDDAVNYGAIGGVIGHEFTHGFDDRGRKYNAFGNLSNWWTKRDREHFSTRTNKMVQQYDAYQPLAQTFVNGTVTLGENIADLGGLTLAYYAYKQSHVDGAEEAPAELEGFSWDQRIFLGWGRVWQSNQTEEYLRSQVMTDSHSPARYRVNGPMSNMPEFKRAWGCESGDAMVRADSLKIRIW